MYANDTLKITSKKYHENLRQLTPLLLTKQAIGSFSMESLHLFQVKNDDRSFYYLDFDATNAYSKFSINNTLNQSTKTIISFSYPFLEDVSLYRFSENGLVLLDRTGLKSKKKSSGRKWHIALDLLPNETTTYYLVFGKAKGKPISSEVQLMDSSSYEQSNTMEHLGIGAYFGLILLSLIFSLFIFWLIRKWAFVLYGFYLVVLSIFIGSYLGYSNMILPGHILEVGKTIYVLSIELSTILFVLFAQHILQAKKYMPKLKRFVEIIVLFQIVSRLGLHFLYKSAFNIHTEVFMKFWYFTILLLVLSVIVQIIIYIIHNPKIGSYFALSFFCMAAGSILVLLHHSFGVVSASVFGLPTILYASTMELLLLTVTISLILGKIYQDRNVLAKKLVVQQQQFLNAFLQGQEEERSRIGRELHDNIGSKISQLKRTFESKFSDQLLESSFDAICENVRDLAHHITPAEISLVGLPAAIQDLTETVEKTENFQIHFSSYGFPEELDDHTATHIFRIVQELLQNVVKHAKASLVTIQLFGHEKSVALSFEDDGIGLPKKGKPNGLGLQNIQHRVAQMKGEFLLDSKKGENTSVLVIIPTKNT